jgi:hypothetical protein
VSTISNLKCVLCCVINLVERRESESESEREREERRGEEIK